jgi:hypothetical protein
MIIIRFRFRFRFRFYNSKVFEVRLTIKNYQ